MPIFEFHVSSVISRTNEIYIEKIINNLEKSKKIAHSLIMSHTNESNDKQVLHSFLMTYPRFTP
jgi:hypothetical protein